MNMLQTTQTLADTTQQRDVTSIPWIIGTINGQTWLRRWEDVHALLTPALLYKHVVHGCPECSTDLTGSTVYSKEADCQTETRYEIVNAWQVNYVCGVCKIDGTLLDVSEKCSNDEELFCKFHSQRQGAMVLDVGCNTGRNMTRARLHGGPGTEVYGIEYSHDSVAIARSVHGNDHIVQGDASANFVDEQSWQGKFSVVQCTAVLQHMTPDQVIGVLGNISSCLASGGELLLTFKDAPTKQQMQRWGMSQWADEVFTADIVSESDYLTDGFLRAVMWDDDYYPGVTSEHPPLGRDLALAGLHRREFVFYSLEWIKRAAMKHDLIAERVEVLPDSKIPYSALHWMVVFRHHPREMGRTGIMDVERSAGAPAA